MATIIKILHKCEMAACPDDATHHVLDHRGDWTGSYCLIHAKLRRDQLSEEERERFIGSRFVLNVKSVASLTGRPRADIESEWREDQRNGLRNADGEPVAGYDG